MRRWLVWAAGAVGAVVLWFVAPAMLRHLTLFRVRRVEVVGTRYLAPTDVVRVMQVPATANLFDDLTPWRDRVLAMPGVREVEVGRRIPGALVVTVAEFDPVALTMLQGRLVPVDRRGRILPFDPTRAATDLPIAIADPMVTTFLDLMRDTDPDLFQTVLSGNRDRSTIIVETVTQRLLFRTGASAHDIQALAVVKAEAKRLGMVAEELDARFDRRVLVRRRRG